MGKIAFVFAGQGAQYPGMGKELCEASDAARAVFETMERCRPGTMAQCFTGSQEVLNQTENTQPCLYTVDLAAARALAARGVEPDMVAGFSLGEVPALTFAGGFSDEEGCGFVIRRGLAMQQAAAAQPGAMAAVLKLPNETVEALCKEFCQVYPVNYNCPGQLVVAGAVEEMAAFQARVAQAGGKAVPLKVSGGFHTPMMKPAAEELEAALAEISFGPLQLPVYANVSGKPDYETSGKTLLLQQVQSPVRWQETVMNMAAAGVTTFVEVGPGKTLSGLIRKTVKDAKVLQVQDRESLEKTMLEVQ